MNTNLETKKALYQQCMEFVDTRLNTVQKAIREVHESLSSETKSTAGDKHETGRAMLQLDREKLGQQLAGIQNLKQGLRKINIETTSNKVGLGSLVYTSQHHYFISISAGELLYNNDKFYAISFSTPIAKALLAKQVGDSIQFRNSTFAITKIT